MDEGGRPQAFLMMPFSEELDWLHDEILEAGLQEGVDTTRADSIFAPGAILQQIIEQIDSADIVIAVCTGKNANVFFELGYAWRHHKPILVASDSDDLPFDVAAYRAELYGRDKHGTDRHSLKLRLRKAIRAALADERLPAGRRLHQAPSSRSSARLVATLYESGRSSYRLTVSNTGNIELHNVDVKVPDEASSFHLHADDELPIDTLRPGNSIKLPATTVMGGGKRIFDVIMTGENADGESFKFFSKISI